MTTIRTLLLWQASCPTIWNKYYYDNHHAQTILLWQPLCPISMTINHLNTITQTTIWMLMIWHLSHPNAMTTTWALFAWHTLIPFSNVNHYKPHVYNRKSIYTIIAMRYQQYPALLSFLFRFVEIPAENKGHVLLYFSLLLKPSIRLFLYASFWCRIVKTLWRKCKPCLALFFIIINAKYQMLFVCIIFSDWPLLLWWPTNDIKLKILSPLVKFEVRR